MEQAWFSNLFGNFVCWGGILSAVAACAVSGLLSKDLPGFEGEITESRMHDIGKMMFAFSIFWFYLFWAQYLVIYYGNLPEETYYLRDRLGDQFLIDKGYSAAFASWTNWDFSGASPDRLRLDGDGHLGVLGPTLLRPFGQRPKKTPVSGHDRSLLLSPLARANLPSGPGREGRHDGLGPQRDRRGLHRWIRGGGALLQPRVPDGRSLRQGRLSPRQRETMTKGGPQDRALLLSTRDSVRPASYACSTPESEMPNVHAGCPDRTLRREHLDPRCAECSASTSMGRKSEPSLRSIGPHPERARPPHRH